MKRHRPFLSINIQVVHHGYQLSHSYRRLKNIAKQGGRRAFPATHFNSRPLNQKGNVVKKLVRTTLFFTPLFPSSTACVFLRPSSGALGRCLVSCSFLCTGWGAGTECLLFPASRTLLLFFHILGVGNLLVDFCRHFRPSRFNRVVLLLIS